MRQMNPGKLRSLPLSAMGRNRFWCSARYMHVSPSGGSRVDLSELKWNRRDEDRVQKREANVSGRQVGHHPVYFDYRVEYKCIIFPLK